MPGSPATRAAGRPCPSRPVEFHSCPHPAARLALRQPGVTITPMLRMGIDYGGTKLEYAVLGADGEICLRRRTAAPVGYDNAIAALADVVQMPSQAELRSRSAVGIGIPGVISPGHGLSQKCQQQRPQWPCFGQATSATRLGQRNPGRERRQLLRFVGGVGRRWRRRTDRVRRHHRNGLSAPGVVVDGAVIAGRHRDRRGMGPQPAALGSAPTSFPLPRCWCGLGWLPGDLSPPDLLSPATAMGRMRA